MAMVRLRFAGAALLLAGAAGSLSRPSAQPLPGPRLQRPEWKAAVVFRRDRDARRYLGTVQDPVLPAQAGRPSPTASERAGAPRRADLHDYEIWLARDGETRGLWYSSRRQTWGGIEEGSPGDRAHADDGTLRRLVKSARMPSTAERPKPPDARATASMRGPLSSLEVQCRGSEIIAIGRVAGILRQAHSPENSTNDMQHTVYLFAVEQSLKTDRFGERAILKVWQRGGWLPWRDPQTGVRGVGYVMDGDPMLAVGERYLLFLRLPDQPGKEQLGYVGEVIDGVRGKSAELDEYLPVHPWGGKFLLRQGNTQAPEITGHETLDHWRFVKGPQILDVPEAVAIQRIRETLAKLATEQQ